MLKISPFCFKCVFLTHLVPMFPFIWMFSNILQPAMSRPPENVWKPLTFSRDIEMDCSRVLENIETNGNVGTKWVNLPDCAKQVRTQAIFLHYFPVLEIRRKWRGNYQKRVWEYWNWDFIFKHILSSICSALKLNIQYSYIWLQTILPSLNHVKMAFSRNGHFEISKKKKE